MFNKILVAVDGSEYANRAVDVAVDLIEHYQASIILLHVIREMALPKEIEAMISAGEITASRLEILQDSGQIILDGAEEKFKAAGVSSDVKSEMITGSPATRIADYAEQNGVDLIVMGHRGLSSERDLLGSVSGKVTNITKISCLIVK